jgi:arylsulfatase A-like enzyme
MKKSHCGCRTTLVLIFLTLFYCSGNALAAGKPLRPHIIFILTDDFGWGDLGSYGGHFVPTPHLDRMARKGIRFTQFYVASPICSPSRTGLTTGMFPARWRITSFLQTRKGNAACEQADYLDSGAPSLARLLKSSGYATAHIGKWHMGGGRDVSTGEPFSTRSICCRRYAASPVRRCPGRWFPDSTGRT